VIFNGESSGESKNLRKSTFAINAMISLAKVAAKVTWRKCESNMPNSLKSLAAKAKAFSHTTYGAPLEAARPFRISSERR